MRVVVISAGLTAACHLIGRRYAVTVVERQPAYGVATAAAPRLGRSSRVWPRCDGFDFGPHFGARQRPVIRLRQRLHPGAVLTPNSQEVMDWAWTPWEQLVAAISATPFVFSPWAVAQVRELQEHAPF